MSKIMESEGIKVSESIRWNKEENKASQGARIDVSELSETDLKRLLLRIEASLSEKQQLKEKVVSSVPKVDDGLPW
jgi:rRNA maturation endonuclease Nob1